MPNGGPDNCGTCCFNSTHEGEVGYIETDAEVRCVIRDVPIVNPMWTYCANHHYPNADRVDVPVGPVYVDAGEYPYRREVWLESPDSEAIRATLLDLLGNIGQGPKREKPDWGRFDAAVIDQIGEFCEPRAEHLLRRLIDAAPLGWSIVDPEPDRDRLTRGAHAIAALARITGDAALPEIERGLDAGLPVDQGADPSKPSHDPFAVVRYFSVQALACCSPHSASLLLERATDDPDGEVAALARTLLVEHCVRRFE